MTGFIPDERSIVAITLAQRVDGVGKFCRLENEFLMKKNSFEK